MLRLQHFLIALAWASAAICGAKFGLRYGFQPGMLIALGLLPLWLPNLTKYIGLIAVQVLTGISLISALLLGWYTATYSTHGLNNEAAAGYLFRLLAFGFILGLLLWVREQIGTGNTAIAYGFGLLVTNLGSVAGSANPWKFQLSIPLTLILLGLCHRKGLLTNLIALTGLAAVGALADSRSYSGLAAVTAMILLFAWFRQATRTAWNRFTLIFVAAAGVAATYYAATSLLVQGALGSEIATRTEAQLNQSGNLITGGRPEWAATIRLFDQYPFGLGAGIRPTGNDITTIKEGLNAVGVPTYIGYVENYMTAGEFKLHSILADLWAGAGIPGALLGLYLIGLAGYYLLTKVAVTGVTALSGYLVTNAVWFIAFGPFYTDLPFLAIAFALLAIPRTEFTLRAAYSQRRAAKRTRAIPEQPHILPLPVTTAHQQKVP